MVIKLLKKVLFYLLIVLALATLTLLSIGKKPINQFFEQQLVSAAQQQGVRLAFENFDIGIRSLSAKSAEVFVPAFLMLLPFEKIAIEPLWSALFSGSINAILKAQFAGSDATLTATDIGPQGAVISAHIQNLDIASLQQLALLGITSGNAEIHADAVRIDANSDFPRAGTIGIVIQHIEKPKPTTIALSMGELPFSLTIPALKRGKIESVANFGEGSQAVLIRKFDWLSSWGAVSLSGTVSSDRQLKLKGEIFLSDEGSEAFRSYLPLISQGKLKYDTKKFSFTVNGPSQRPQVQFSELG
jgi:hypothetical protein